VGLNPVHVDVYSIQCYVINLSVSCDSSVVFSEYFGFFHQNKSDGHDITEILLKVALSTINLNLYTVICVELKQYHV